jgi:acyl dehydratase
MAINRDCLGKIYPPTEPYEVSREKLREFADAIGEHNPVYRSRAAAIEAGFPDVIGSPTFAIVITMAGNDQVFADPEVNLDFTQVVHGDQRFVYSRPLQAGDVVTTEVRISDIKQLGRNSMLSTETEIRTVDGEHVVTAYSMIVERGVAQ